MTTVVAPISGRVVSVMKLAGGWVCISGTSREIRAPVSACVLHESHIMPAEKKSETIVWIFYSDNLSAVRTVVMEADFTKSNWDIELLPSAINTKDSGRHMCSQSQCLAVMSERPSVDNAVHVTISAPAISETQILVSPGDIVEGGITEIMRSSR